MEDDNFKASTASFLTWLVKSGVKINPKMEILDLRAEGRGRGVVAVDDFEEDEIVFSVPRAIVMNLPNLLPTVSPEISQKLSAMPSWLSLTSLMIAESLKPNSKWTPYLAVLPRQIDSLVFWSDSELAHLQASKVVEKIGKAKAEEMFSQHIAPLGLQNCDIDMCHRVASIIMAYAFDIPDEKTSDEIQTEIGKGEEEGDDLVSDHGDDEQTILSMIPLADMLNADADRNNARLCCDNEDLEMRTIKPIAKGEEIFNDYGSLPQSDLLRRYGYVTDRYAPYDVAELSTNSIIESFGPESRIQINPPGIPNFTQSELDMRIELAEREGVYEESYDLNHPGPDGPGIPDELLALVYILMIDEETFAAISTSKMSLPSRSKLATRQVAQALMVLMKAREHEYATSPEKDQEILRGGNLPSRERMAIQVRLGEKQVLRAAIFEASSYMGSNKRMRLSNTPVEEPKSGSKKRGATSDETSTKRGRTH